LADAGLGVERTDFVGIPTQDLEQSERFYEDVLGLRRNPNHSPGWPEFETGNLTLLLTDVAKTGVTFSPNVGAVALRVPDVEEAMARLRAAGVEFQFEEPYDSSVCRMAFFQDPDGNAVILHRRYKPYE
jgi:catechol 2,3-dioxygenase-like lactoylglutathione lyase family enzyme